MKNFFTPREVTRILGISYRQIQYWDKTKFIGPSYRRRGRYRLYTRTDLLTLKVAVTLHAATVSIQQLRRLIRTFTSLLPKISWPLIDCTILVNGPRILIFGGELLIAGDSAEETIRIDAKSFFYAVDAMFEEPAPGAEEKFAPNPAWPAAS